MKRERLIKVLDELVALLVECGETRWADWMRGSAECLRRRDFSGIDRLLSAYGGMGSFNDVSVPPGRSLRFEQLSGDAFQLAVDIKREATSE